jgi:hypothetical protein
MGAVYDQAEAKAQSRGETVRDVIERALRAYLRR